jgi:tetratricopeptide (TPR) repeat protein
VKKKYYRYLVFFLLFVSIGVLTIDTPGFHPSSYLFSRSTNNSLDHKSGDSLTVIELNKKAFNTRLTDPNKTVEIADSALKLARGIKYLPGIAEAYRVSGVGFSHLENNSLSTKNYIEALRCFKQLKDHKKVARTYSNIGNLYNYNNPNKALKYYHSALRIADRINDEELLGGIYFNIALVYSRNSEYNKSLINFDRSYNIFRKLKDTMSIVLYLQSTGRVYHRLHQIDSAKSRLIKAIEAAKDLKHYTSLSGCYLSLSYIYLEQNKFKLAEATISEGIKYSRKVGNRVLDNDFVRFRYELELKRKNYKKALTYLSLAYQNDSLLLNENQSSNIDINSQHYLQQQKIREKELIITKQKFREANFRWIITLCILGLLLTVVIGLILYFLREKRRRKEQLVIQSKITALEQKTLQAMMNPHFVFNVMTAIQHFINQADMKTANQVLSGFAHLTRKHLEICMNSTISVREELVYLRLYLSLEKIRFLENLSYEITIDEKIDTDEIYIPSMLIQPFIENAIWHGIMPKDEGGIIQLNFDLNETELLISIIDDGVGILNSENRRKTGHISRGMELIRERVNLLNRLNKRHIFIDQHQTGDYGTEVLIRIPL